MSTATGIPSTPPAVDRPIVWLPLSLPNRRSDTGMSEFLPGQMSELADSLPVPSHDVVSPDPLGMRSDFRARLEANLDAGQGPALEDFSLLIEGIVYGLLRPKTYDLADYSLGGSRATDKYLTVLLFKAHPQGNETCAGSFAPETLVCPAPAWREREELEQKVLEYRNRNDGVAARGLLAAFLATYGGANLVWMRAVTTILGRNPGHDPGEANQRNIGAIYLRISGNADPIRVFLPVYRSGYAEDLLRRLCSDTVIENGDQLDFLHQGRIVCSLSRIAHREPALFGCGSERDVAAVPGPTAIQLTETVLDRLAEISNEYLKAGAPAKPRFELPDCLRYFFWKFGSAAEYMLRPGAYLYSLNALSLISAPWPHETNSTDGMYHDTTGQTVFYVEPAGTGHAYYIESYRGTQIQELSTVGYVLWLIFCKEARWDDTRSEAVYSGMPVLGVRNGRLWIASGLIARQPDFQRKALEVISFVACAEKPPQPSLFNVAAKTYLGSQYLNFQHGMAHQNDIEPIKIGGRQWYRLR
jgi:hypothetical protein